MQRQDKTKRKQGKDAEKETRPRGQHEASTRKKKASTAMRTSQGAQQLSNLYTYIYVLHTYTYVCIMHAIPTRESAELKQNNGQGGHSESGTESQTTPQLSFSLTLVNVLSKFKASVNLAPKKKDKKGNKPRDEQRRIEEEKECATVVCLPQLPLA